MIDDEERREVARRLREANVRREFYSPWCRMVESVLDGTDCGEDDGTCDENACCERFMKRVADLIEPEKTGLSSLSGVCPKCGCSTYVVCDDYDWWVITCDACGAKKGFDPGDYIPYEDIESKWKESMNAD